MDFDSQRHGLSYAPEYPPNGFSDHLPMAWQALNWLEAAPERRDRFAAAYLPRLTPLSEQAPERRRVGELLAEIRADGIAPVLRRRLPALISGWFREAYHPLIRLAYGVEADNATEVAAAIAYWEAAGPCQRLADLAAAAPLQPDIPGLEILNQAAGWQPPLDGTASFGARAARILEQPEMAAMSWTVSDNLAQASRAALDAFAATHDFFALHLVTGSHAFRVVRPYLDLPPGTADATLNLGLLSGYVAIGAPRLTPYRPTVDHPPPDRSRLLALCREDEHDFKVAWSAVAQAEHWNDPAYLLAAERYLRASAGRVDD